MRARTLMSSAALLKTNIDSCLWMTDPLSSSLSSSLPSHCLPFLIQHHASQAYFKCQVRWLLWLQDQGGHPWDILTWQRRCPQSVRDCGCLAAAWAINTARKGNCVRECVRECGASNHTHLYSMTVAEQVLSLQEKSCGFSALSFLLLC